METPARPLVSVLMPTYDQPAFLPRAIASLLRQTYENWELIVVDDGSPPSTADAIAAFLPHPRIHPHRHPTNTGLGTTLNRCMDEARGEYVAYLPSDDVYTATHLASLVAALENDPEAGVAISGMRFNYNKFSEGRVDGSCLQLVQIMHRKTSLRWKVRAEITTDDLDRMFFGALLNGTKTVSTGQITCEWVAHPDQRHRHIQEHTGGVNTYRSRYRVPDPLVFHSSVGHLVDEKARFERYRNREITPPPASTPLNILLTGELAYNPERVLALAEAGHRLFGLWTERPMWFNYVGPQPFGHVTDLPRDNWQAAAFAVGIDVIYGLLNWQAVPFAHSIMLENPGFPFVWHFKEGPFICIEKGTWPELARLYASADGRIYCSPENRVWFEEAIPDLDDSRPSLVLDGDLPRREAVDGVRSRRLSEQDGEIHTVVPGRPIGLHPEMVAELAAGGVHLHFYGEFTHTQWAAWIEKTRRLAGRFIHLHPNMEQERWAQEFSQYDAGWLHFFQSQNEGELVRADWDDLNIPARVATLAAAGLPMLQRRNAGHIVATQRLVDSEGLGLSADSMAGMVGALSDRERLRAISDTVWAKRDRFTFDHHVPALESFFRSVIAAAGTPALRLRALA